MFLAPEAVQPDYPVHETGFTPNEIQELLSIFQQSSPPSPNSGSHSSSQAVYSVDERKRRRMISNRESARRSRWRKKRHVENLTEQLDRLKIENRVLKNRFGSVLNQCHALRRENEWLETESMALRARLSDLRRVLVAMHAMRRPQ